MASTSIPRELFTRRRDAYVWFIRAIRYGSGLLAFFLTSSVLRDDLRILDAGCGTGALTAAVAEAMRCRGFKAAAFHAFDLTPAMLAHLRTNTNVEGLELALADVLELNRLPDGWNGYDLIVSAAMLEYVPRERFVDALRGLQVRLKPGGTFVLFISRRNPLMHLLIAWWWAANLYTRRELSNAFHAAGFTDTRFPSFPVAAARLSLWGHIVEAKRPGTEPQT